MNATEQRLRQELAACYRLIAHFRMSDLIFTHISLRLPGPEHHFLINRTACCSTKSRPPAW